MTSVEVVLVAVVGVMLIIECCLAGEFAGISVSEVSSRV